MKKMLLLLLPVMLLFTSSCTLLEGLSELDQNKIDTHSEIKTQKEKCDNDLKVALAEKEKLEKQIAGMTASENIQITQLKKEITQLEADNRVLQKSNQGYLISQRELNATIAQQAGKFNMLNDLFVQMDRLVRITKSSLDEDGIDQGEGWGLATRMDELYGPQLAEILGVNRYELGVGQVQRRVKEYSVPQRRNKSKSFNKEQ